MKKLKKFFAKKYLTKDDIKERNQRAEVLIESVFDMYYATACQCAYPRFQQIVDVTRSACTCYDTELTIGMSRKYFNTEKSNLTDEDINEKWVCKKCHSTYEYSWSEFSVAIDRTKLKLTDLKIKSIGEPAVKPIPIYLGMRGYTYPSKSEVIDTDYEEFETYMLEK